MSEGTLIEVELSVPDSRPAGAVGRMGAGVEPIGNDGGAGRLRLREFATMDLQDIQAGIATVCDAVLAAMRQVKPQSCDVEVALGFKAGAKVPVIVSGEANASLKITLHWAGDPGAQAS